MTDESKKLAQLASLRRKIEKLNRKPLESAPPRPSSAPAGPPASAECEPVVFSRFRPRLKVEPRRDSTRLSGRPRPLEEVVPGDECAAGGGAYYRIDRLVAELDAAAAALPHRLRTAMDQLALGGLDPAGDRGPVPLERVCFLDLETTGLGCTPVFLIGLLLVRNDEILCRQLLARTYAEETSIVEAYGEIAAATDMVVTFNGKSFDVPFLRTRAAATGVDLPVVDRHLDLLHVSRRVFGKQLPNCKLQTLERHVCGRRRGDDVPGAEIPRVYHDFVRSGDARMIARILKHNLHDLVTLADLTVRVCSPEASGPRLR